MNATAPHADVMVRYEGEIWRYRGPGQRPDGTVQKRTAGHGRFYPGYSVLEDPIHGDTTVARNDLIQVK